MGRLADFLELVSFEHRRIPALPGVLGEISRELELEVPTDSATCSLNAAAIRAKVTHLPHSDGDNSETED